ncbi:DUF202 domain-containing protein [Goekera deserti]|uniref:DUF202 domain-containing protein n=1 Tax=Goekera deserti TaxID=2497753 RepID=UPI001F31752D|nr:hypothetical protein [Goekera deserti]
MSPAPPPAGGVPRRPGETQPARTALAWQRTALGVLAVAALLARAAVVRDRPLVVLPAAVVALAGLALLGAAGPHRLRTARQAAETGGSGRAARGAALATGVVVLTALAGLAAVALLP